MSDSLISADLPPVTTPVPPPEGASPAPGGGEAGFTVSPLVQPAHRQRRRFLFFSTVVLITGLASAILADILWSHHISTARVLLLVLFIPLCAMVALGFVQASAGFLLLARRRDNTRITRSLPNPVVVDNLPVTAIVMPIYNENVREVYEGLRVIYHSLERIGAHTRFDFFILSDSNDPNKWIEEEAAWVELCKQLNGFGHIFYRRRRMPINRKSGNIADFCRRWGGRYRYMMVLDADSLMVGRTLVNLVALMEANPRVGILQSSPVLYGGTTPFARLMQFSSSAYGPIFSAGQHYWQLNEGNYWGHNAIIRLKPFIEHCGLPDVPGASGASKYMSHDYVEAALMAKFGYEVWMAYDLPGSFEGGPPTLIDHAKRDLRWCRGNLQHAWLVFAKGFRPISRLHLGVGVFSYVSSLLWLLFLLAGTLHWYQSTLAVSPMDTVSTGFLTRQGIHLLPFYLFAVMMGLLLLPKVMAASLILNRPERRRRFGGGPQFVCSVLLEQVVATLLAPILMMFNAVFVISVLLGKTVHWTTQNRDVAGVDWREAMLTHTSHILIGVTWGLLALRIDPYFFAWMSPVLAGLIFSVPLSILLSHQGFSDLLHRAGLLMTPIDTAPAREIVEYTRRLGAYEEVVPPPMALWAQRGFMQVILDPLVNAVHVALLRQRGGKTDHEVGGYYRLLMERVLKEGPAALSRREQMALLLHPGVVADLHSRIWLLPDRELAPWWRVAMSQYNLISGRQVHLLQP
ncbi:MAG: glucans biosynthesis glucosyltransferase MdoH [Kiritimatiellia bacterium]